MTASENKKNPLGLSEKLASYLGYLYQPLIPLLWILGALAANLPYQLLLYGALVIFVVLVVAGIFQGQTQTKKEIELAKIRAEREHQHEWVERVQHPSDDYTKQKEQNWGKMTAYMLACEVF